MTLERNLFAEKSTGPYARKPHIDNLKDQIELIKENEKNFVKTINNIHPDESGNIDLKSDDTGWIDAKLGDNFSTSKVKYRIKNGVVYISGFLRQVATNMGDSKDPKIAAILPKEASPNNNSGYDSVPLSYSASPLPEVKNVPFHDLFDIKIDSDGNIMIYQVTGSFSYEIVIAITGQYLIL